jgi:hypothetical protein
MIPNCWARYNVQPFAGCPYNNNNSLYYIVASSSAFCSAVGRVIPVENVITGRVIKCDTFRHENIFALFV